MIIRPRHALDRTAFLVGLSLVGLVAIGCEQAVPPGSPGSPSDSADVLDPTVGEVAGTAIRLSDIENPVLLQLFDLDMQRYRLLRQSLEAAALETIEDQTGADRVAELRLQPPDPVRVDVAIDPARTRPESTAPVTILVFCNFESPHCARMQTTLDRMMTLFDGVVREAARHFSLPFHRNADLAAEAALCALEQDAYWRFHDRLYAGTGAPDRERIDTAMRGALLDEDAFAACLDSRRHAAAVAEDNEAALGVGLDQVPAVFVNGLYAGNTVDAARLVWLIEYELARLGIASPRQVGEATTTSAPLLLNALLHSRWPGQGLAVLAVATAPDRTGHFREGDVIGNSLILRRITDSGVELIGDGRLQWLAFGDDHLATSAAVPAPEETRSIVRPHRAVPVTLDRNEVLVRLADRIALDEVLETVPMKSGDYRQLRIAEVRPGSLYELLGLQAGDVLLGVNEQPVHEAENPLWDALERDDEVRVRVMRPGGVAHHFTYRFDDPD